jgi:outer membrane protein OmpA-like peptidoglycan-associated protein
MTWKRKPVTTHLTTWMLGGLALLAACSTPAPVVDARKIPVLQVEQIERGVLIVLPSAVLFEVGKSEINAIAAKPHLDRVAQLLTTKTTKSVSLEGHTDSDGPAALNDSLSLLRAQSLAQALETRGVAMSRISAAGFSFNRPAASNATDEGKRLNRRVEVIVLDEKLGTMTAGEPAGSFESAWARIKDMIDRGLVKPATNTP